MNDRKTQVNRRRELRRRSTKPEQLLWSALRSRRFSHLKFRRQHPIGPFIADFCCVQRRLVIELDGDYHEYVEADDASRQEFLEEQGYRVLRFRNEDVLQDTEAVLMAIAKTLSLAPSP